MVGCLEGKVAVVTGGTTGIGLATAKKFVAEGAHVFIMGRRKTELDAAVVAIGKQVTAVQGDVTRLIDLDRLYSTVKAEKGKLDIVFANAAIAELAPLEQVTEEHFDRHFDINVKGTVFTVQKALPLLSQGASIIITTSISGVKGQAGLGIYSATKAALRNLVRTWVLDLKGRGIRVNAIAPGPLDTDGFRAAGGDPVKRAQTIPTRRMILPTEVAAACVFLADPIASLTGQTLILDGGSSAVGCYA